MERVVPAIIPTSFEHLRETLEQLSPFARTVQVDIVDGMFVPPRSWPYVGQGALMRLKEYTDDFDIEMDLMIQAPETVLESYVTLGVHSVVIHLESTQDLTRILEIHREHPFRLGFSIGNETPLQMLTDVIDSADYVQLMGIKTIGSQGQPFDERVLDRIRTLRSANPDLIISIDGSVNHESIVRLKDAGANRFVVGSAILGAPDPALAFRTLTGLLRSPEFL